MDIFVEGKHHEMEKNDLGVLGDQHQNHGQTFFSIASYEVRNHQPTIVEPKSRPKFSAKLR